MLSPEQFAKYVHAQPEAPHPFVEALEKIVLNAQAKLERGGEVARVRGYGKEPTTLEQRVTLFDEKSHRLYQVIDQDVSIIDRKIVSVGREDSGLLIIGFGLTAKNEVTTDLGTLSLPRHTSYCGQYRDYETTNPLLLEILGAEISRAKIVPNDVFSRAQRIYNRFIRDLENNPYDATPSSLGNI
jgi:hypothetical protein